MKHRNPLDASMRSLDLCSQLAQLQIMIGDDKEVAQGRTRDGMRWRVTVEILEHAKPKEKKQ